jgi:uncharacterized membrane protein
MIFSIDHWLMFRLRPTKLLLNYKTHDFKFFGVILIFVGVVLIAKHQLYLVGLILLFIGFYLAMKIRMKPL